MSTLQMTEHEVRLSATTRLVGWGLLAGGVCFFVGGAMHPKEDPPGVTRHEVLRLMFVDRAWYPAHFLVLIGSVLIAAALVALVRGRTLAVVPRAQRVRIIAAVGAVLGAVGALVHLLAALDAGRIAAHAATPFVDLMGPVETLTVPAFGFSIATLAVIGALTRTLSNRVTAVLGVIGGVAYGIAGATIMFTDRLDFLFPAAGGIGLWTVAAGIGLLLGARARARDRSNASPDARPTNPGAQR